MDQIIFFGRLSRQPKIGSFCLLTHRRDGHRNFFFMIPSKNRIETLVKNPHLGLMDVKGLMRHILYDRGNAIICIYTTTSYILSQRTFGFSLKSFIKSYLHYYNLHLYNFCTQK